MGSLMGRVKNLLVDLYQLLEDRFGSPEEDDPISPTPQEIITPPIIPLTEEECFNFNLDSTDLNLEIIEKIDYKTYLLLLMAGHVNIPEKGKLEITELFTTESFLMELWLLHVANRVKFKDFYSLIANKEYFLPVSKEVTKDNQVKPKQKKIKCLHDLPLQKKLLN